MPPSTAPTHRAAIDVARAYIAAGVAVFPCRESNQDGIDHNTGEYVTWAEKSPYTSNGLNGATVSRRIIDILFLDRYPNALIGVPTGDPLGAWVLDLDTHGEHDGHVWLADMEAMHGALPPTARASTANGGTHVFFRHTEGVRNRAAIAPGVDTRGTGGYIVAPGSVMADGRSYDWIDADGVLYQPDGMPEFAEAPPWLLELVLPRPVTQAATDYTYTPGGNHIYVERAVDAELTTLARASTGSRGAQVNASAFSLGTLVGAGVLSRGEAESGLWDAAVACGVVAKDGEREIRKKIQRGLDAGIKQPRQVPEPAAGDNTPSIDAARMLENARKKAEAKKHAQESAPSAETGTQNTTSNIMDAKQDNVQSIVHPAGHAPRKRERFELTWFDDIEEGKPKVTFVKNVLGEREFTTVSGLPGTGKSVIVTDMACHVAAGREWHGRKVRQGLVVYVAAERKKLTERRMMAFRHKHGVEHVPLLVVGGRLDFTASLKDARDLIAAIKQAEFETGMQCVWIIIDTLTRVFGAGDQNASKDMSRFVQSCDELLAETTAHVTAIHHSAWSGERGKGAIDLDGAVDASFMVKKDHGKYKLVCDGTNDGEEGDILAFTMESVTLGHDEDGEPTTAPVVVPSDGKGGVEGMLAAKTHKDKALVVLMDMIDDGEETPATRGFPATGKIIPEEAWRHAVYDSMGDDMLQPTKQATFNRSKKSLLKYKDIGEQGIWVWPLSKE